jgi:ATP-binding cassette subfamily B multidrug efflux pump
LWPTSQRTVPPSAQRLSLNFHNNYSVGRLMSRLIGDVGVLQDFHHLVDHRPDRSVFNLVGIVIAMLF